MGDVAAVSKYNLTLEQHEKCISYLYGETEVPEEDAPQGVLDTYVRCAEAHQLSGKFNSNCSLFPEGKLRKECKRINFNISFANILGGTVIGFLIGLITSVLMGEHLMTVAMSAESAGVLIDPRGKEGTDPTI